MLSALSAKQDRGKSLQGEPLIPSHALGVLRTLRQGDKKSNPLYPPCQGDKPLNPLQDEHLSVLRPFEKLRVLSEVEAQAQDGKQNRTIKRRATVIKVKQYVIPMVYFCERWH